MASELTQALSERNASSERKDIRELIERYKPEIQRVLPASISPERLARTYMTEIRRNPLLLECTTESLLAALMLSAQVGLDPGPLGYVYLVPFKKECTWILGYTGIIELARRAGVAGVTSEIIWDCDSFEPPWRNERGIHFMHRPGMITDRNERVGVLVTWKESGTVHALHVPPERIKRAREASPAARKGSGPWFTDEDAMWRKTGVRAARPFLPLSPAFALATVMDETTLAGLDPETETGVLIGGDDDAGE